MPQPTIFTIGHSTRTVSEFVELLQQVDVDMLVDVRIVPRSRFMPAFNSKALATALTGHGIGYHHIAALGGHRSHPKGAPPSTNTFWRVTGFRNYADYAQTAEFHTGLAELVALSQDHRCAIMCAEAVWWRCHRRIIADALLTQGVPVKHIMARGVIATATRTTGAVVLPNGTLHYPAPARNGKRRNKEQV